MLNLNHLVDLRSLKYDAIIDVRSPSEYAEDHMPGAINLPVLDDAERARVGTIYKQTSPFDARKIGAALVFRNAATHIETRLAHQPGGWRPLVYCWRGGQRSGTFSWMLNQIGWPAETVSGGYKSFRRTIVDYLYSGDLPFKMIRLGGHTGTGKTELLARLRARGVQVVDLEALAEHRGSVLGALKAPQPSQKTFETRLARTLDALDPARLVIVEAESSKIGAISLPPALWKAMKASPVVEVDAPIEERARYLAQAYKTILDDAEGLKRKLAPLRHLRGHDLVDHWNLLIDRDDRVALCQSLAVRHYDPAYAKASRDHDVRPIARFSTVAMSPEAFDQLAGEIERKIQTISI